MSFTFLSRRLSPDHPVDSGSGLPIPPAGHTERNRDEGSTKEDDSFSGGVDSAARKASAQLLDAEPNSNPSYAFARISVGIIILVWLVTGYLKVKDINAFVEIVTMHRVIPESMHSVLWWVGPAEILMGLLLVFALGSELRKPFGKLVLLISMSAIAGFMYYISKVDPAVLQESGCGCLSDYRIASGIETVDRVMKYGFNTILLILHIVALFGPAMVDSRRR
tara:strand:- start:2030 stop:2695 length:666 start_codon:yes stop_codon:yes gene_type:complete